jgi:hypothetical protein
MAIFYWLLYGLKWKCWRIYNFCCNLFWVYGSIDWTKCPLNNGVSIVQKLVIKLSNTSTMLFPPVAKTLSKCLRVWQVFELYQNTHEKWTNRSISMTFKLSRRNSHNAPFSTQKELYKAFLNYFLLNFV